MGNNPIDEAKKYAGKGERDSAFNRFMSSFWAKVGLPGYRTITGRAFAWCGVFVFAMLWLSGHNPKLSGAAGARNWAKYGQEIDWKVAGVPRGAIVQINHNLSCVSGSGNHVAFANGDCTAEAVTSKGATIQLFGGNQGDMVKVSTYRAAEICAVRWPPDMEKPAKVVKNVACNVDKAGKESTR